MGGRKKEQVGYVGVESGRFARRLASTMIPIVDQYRH